MIKVLMGAAVFATCAASTAMGADAAGLKPIDPAALQASIEGLAKELMLPGAMVLLSTPQGDVVFGYGTTELGTTNPPRADTHFRAASNTKTMTAAAIVQMVQEGKLSFDDPISKYVEGVPDGDKITISQLLKMRSGLFNFTNAPELAESLDDDPDKVWTADEVLGMAFNGRRSSRRAPNTNTTTPTTTCSASSPRRSTASRSRPSSRTACSGRSA